MEELMSKIEKNLNMALSCASSGITDSASMLVLGRFEDVRVTVIITATVTKQQNIDVAVKVKMSDSVSEYHETYTTKMIFLEKEGYTKDSILERILEELQ